MIRNRANQVLHLTRDTISECDQTQENVTYKRVLQSALSKQVTARLQKPIQIK